MPISHSKYELITELKNTVTHMTIVRQRLGTHVPEVTLSTVEGRALLGNGSVDTFLQEQINTQ
jgi:hypothetical protein